MTATVATTTVTTRTAADQIERVNDVDLPIEPATSFSRKPALDGIRAIAVIAVLVYHGQVGFGHGGFLGVDLFFVLSGYLITSLLLVERATHGRIDLPAFWRRRFRRLLPALFALLVAVSMFSAVVAAPSQTRQIRGAGLAALAYVGNWWSIFTGQSYFDQFGDPSPLRHTWSLAIEEQFYVVWPVVIALIAAHVVRRNRVIAALAAAALGSAALMAVLYVPSDPSRVYYGTDTRSQALLVGAVLAFALHGRHLSGRARRLLSGAGLASLAACIGFFVFVRDDSSFMYRGGFLAFAIIAAGLIAACVGHTDNILNRTLQRRTLVGIGAISYGLYLYHWPVYVVLSPGRVALPAVPLLAVRMIVTLALSVASYRFIEMPVRRHGTAGMSTKVIAVLAVAAAVGLIFVAMFAQPSDDDASAVTTPVTPVTAIERERT